jgi:hypothetical protein
MTDTMTSQNIDLPSRNRARWKDNTGRPSQTTKMALSRKPFGIGHIFIKSFLLRMTDTMTSQNIDLSSWDTLYNSSTTDMLRIESRQGRDFPHAPRPSPGPTQPPVQGVPGLFAAVKRPVRDVDHPPPFSVDIEERVALCLYSPLGLSGLLRVEVYLFYRHH